MSRDKHRGNVITSLILYPAFSLDLSRKYTAKDRYFFFFYYLFHRSFITPLLEYTSKFHIAMKTGTI